MRQNHNKALSSLALTTFSTPESFKAGSKMRVHKGREREKRSEPGFIVYQWWDPGQVSFTAGSQLHALENKEGDHRASVRAGGLREVRDVLT